MPATDPFVRLSVVVPVYNETENVLPLLAEIEAALAGRDYEVVFVDDQSEDDTAVRLAGVLGPRVRLIRHRARAGQSAAIRSGALAARGEWMATLDGDGQNDPADLPRLLAVAWAEGGPELVGGLRLKRRDTWSKRVATRIGNGVRQAVLRDGCPDTGCGIKVIRRDLFLRLPFFSAMHRFLPALVRIHGGTAQYVPVNHRPRQRGVSKYGNLSRALLGIVDIMGVVWLGRRTHLPGEASEDLGSGAGGDRNASGREEAAPGAAPY
ncbi:glycosyltransferase [Arenibaculum pallidiluteum]|uniref:glycosyltransferase n=1 Tax=Arenibaculum pallidiluteum TaxID=2812559 RepID=UPI002E27CCA9|nr:glycosyltransferase [Arenibaculum pallidiluteum]